MHYIDNHDKLYRQILIASQAGNPLNRQTLPDTPFRTTNEMLEAFQFLGVDKAKEIIIHNPNELAEEIEEISPVKDGLYTPTIEGADQDIRDLCYNRAKKYTENQYHSL